jgi:hypothetical protein
MKKNVIITALIGLIIFILINNIICYDNCHIGVNTVNPHCSTCGQVDGIVKHNCINPKGEKIYCTVCGKIVIYR